MDRGSTASRGGELEEFMRIANIYPVANQEFYKEEDYVMILAHLLKYYKRESFRPDAYIICDNGLYEEAQVSTSLQSVIDLIEASDVGSLVTEIIIPDTANDIKDTIRLFEENIETVKKYIGKYVFMFVAQATTYDELRYGINYINQYVGTIPNLSIGFSKLSPLDRASDEAVEIIKTAKYPVHCLGLKLSFGEMKKLAPYIRGCDSSQLAYIVKNEEAVPEDAVDYVRDGRREDGRGTIKDIELETDILDTEKTRQFRAAIMKQLAEKLEFVGW